MAVATVTVAHHVETTGGFGSTTPPIPNGESTGGAYPINGATGVASLGHAALDPRTFGARCDGSTDDARAINAALAAAGARGNGGVQIPAGPGCAIADTLIIPARVTLSGTGGKSPYAGVPGGLIAKVANLNMIRLAGNDSTIENILVNAHSRGINSAGTAIAMIPATGQTVRNVGILGAFTGIDVNGNSPLIDNVTINGLPPSGTGLMIGRLTTHAGTTDPRITNSTVGGAGASVAAVDQIIYDAGGLYEVNDDFLYANVGTQIKPAAQQEVTWAFFDNTVLGDTNGSVGFGIDTGDATARVVGFTCSNCWAASARSASSGTNILISNSARGVVDGIHFTGLRSYNSAKVLAYIDGGTNITFDSSQFCGAASAQSDIVVASGISGTAFRGDHIGGACDGNTTSGATGITLSGSNSDILVSNVDFTGIPTPVVGSPAGDSLATANNGMGEPPHVTSAATIMLPGISQNYAIVGSGRIGTIKGGWRNRQIMMLAQNPISFQTGGNICNALTSAPDVPVLGIFTGSCWHLK